MRRLVLVHGRSQENKDSIALKAEWIDAWKTGLRKADLQMPVSEAEIHFPYYGDTLFKLVQGVSAAEVPDVIVRGDGADRARQEFVAAIIAEIAQRENISEDQVAEAAGGEVRERGPQNWKWVRAILQALDRNVPGVSGASIALFTNDVYQYLRNAGIRDRIDGGVRKAMKPGDPTVVVSHSLGTVVAYNLLRREGEAQGWQVPLFVTLGSPLAVAQIYKSLKPVDHPACAAQWYNAMDSRDVVALYPLSKHHFDVDPAIENKTDVRNETPNRHGISGYLSDPVVARRIHDALLQ